MGTNGGAAGMEDAEQQQLALIHAEQRIYADFLVAARFRVAARDMKSNNESAPDSVIRVYLRKPSLLLLVTRGSE